MAVLQQYQKLIEKKRVEADALRTQLTAVEAYIEAIQDAIKLLPKDLSGDGPAAAFQLREGSKLARVRDLLAEHGKAMHINQILAGIGDSSDTKARVALTGSLGQYAREGKTFTKEGPNEFGLLEYPQRQEEAEIEVEEVKNVASFDYAHSTEITDDDIPF
jgi:hypothetical protein